MDRPALSNAGSGESADPHSAESGHEFALSPVSRTVGSLQSESNNDDNYNIKNT